MCNNLLNIMGAKSEFSSSFNEDQKKQLLKGIFHNYYSHLSEDMNIVDSNRSWSARLSLLNQLFPDVKLICCVRNVGWIMDSFERLVQKHPLLYSKMFNDDNERSTVYSRTEALGRQNRIVGYSLAALREAYYGQHSKSLLLVDYELLARFPQKCMDLLYDFLGEKRFQHDTETVAHSETSFDVDMGIPDLHTVRSRISFEERNSILPPDIFEKYNKINFWTKSEGTAASLISMPS
jgi:sulfotransferase